MRILQLITSSELGGAQSVVANISNTLSKEHEVIVAAGEGDGKLWEMLAHEIIPCPCKYLYKAVSVKNDILALKELRSLYKKYKPDIIHLHSSKAGMLGRLAFPKKKIVYTVHGFDSIRVAHRKFLPLEKFMQHFCRSIVAVSQYDYNNLLFEGIKSKTDYIYNGIENPLKTSVEKPEVFNRYDKVVLSIARVAPPKRHDMFIELSRMLPQYGFIWIGNQEEVAGLPENCHFLGNIPNAAAYCRFADIFCLMSDYEGLPMSILEAMASACPIVASDVGGIKEMVRNGENGYVIKNHVEEFADIIDDILKDSQKQKSMGLRSKYLYESLFTVEKMVGSYMNIYQK